MESPALLSAVSPTVNAKCRTPKIGTEAPSATPVTGVGEDYARTSGSMRSDRGVFCNMLDILRRQKVCVVGSYVSNEYFDGAGVGETVKIGGYTYTIIGVLNAKADSSEYGDDNVVLIPLYQCG